MRSWKSILSVLLSVAVLPACSADRAETIVVGAAASLTDAFDEIAAAFEAANPGVDVELTFAGSSSLREQILDGAPLDVFASANLETMQSVVEAGRVTGGAAQEFTSNSLTIVVPPGNRGAVTSLEDFARPGLLIGLCAEAVPCGDFARQALDRAGVTPSVDTDEPDVRALLTKVSLGELDAGIVYRTDVTSADVESVAIPEQFDVTAHYAIASIEDGSPHAGAFVAFVLSDEGQAILERHGFGTR